MTLGSQPDVDELPEPTEQSLESLTGGVPAERGGKNDPFAALRFGNFTRFLFGAFLSNVGNQMRTATVAWEVYDRAYKLYGPNGSKWALAMIGLTMSLPVLVLAMPAGVWADRYSRKWLLILSQLGMASCGFGLAWASWTQAPLWCVYLLLVATGTFRAIGWPPGVALVTSLVPTQTFANAAMWRSIAFQTAMAIGPILVGRILVLWNPAAAYSIDAMTSLVLVAILLTLRLAPHQPAPQTPTWHSLVEGARFVRNQPLILATITLDMVAVLFGGATALIPIYAREILNVGEEGYGWLRAMPSLGAIAMGFAMAVRPPMKRAGRALLEAVSTFGVATIVFGLSTSYALSLAALFVLGAADAISVVVRATLVQLLTPDAMRGRVSAINAIFINTSNELGEFESGVAARYLGTVLATAGGGVMTLLTVTATAIVWPQVLALGRMDQLQPVEFPADDQRGEAVGKPDASV